MSWWREGGVVMAGGGFVMAGRLLVHNEYTDCPERRRPTKFSFCHVRWRVPGFSVCHALQAAHTTRVFRTRAGRSSPADKVRVCGQCETEAAGVARTRPRTRSRPRSPGPVFARTSPRLCARHAQTAAMPGLGAMLPASPRCRRRVRGESATLSCARLQKRPSQPVSNDPGMV